jgi:hypothetical protein
MRFLCKGSAVVVLVVGMLGIVRDVEATTYTYDFDNGQVIGSGFPGVGLVGQDGWADFHFTDARDAGVRSDMATVGMTGNAAANTANYFSPASGLHPILGRKNNANFGYTIPAGAPAVTMEFLARMEDSGSVTSIVTFALAHDADSSGLIDQLSEVGPQIGYANGGFYIREAGYGSEHTSAAAVGSTTAGEVWRIVVDVDFAGNGGDGSGSMSVAQIWDGSTLTPGAPLVPLGDLQGVTLGLGGFAAPQNWDGMSVRMAGAAGVTVDDLSIDVVPEPGTIVALLGAGLMCLAVRPRGRRAVV